MNELQYDVAVIGGGVSGVAAALVSKKHCSVRDVNIKEVQKILTDNFVY